MAYSTSAKAFNNEMNSIGSNSRLDSEDDNDEQSSIMSGMDSPGKAPIGHFILI